MTLMNDSFITKVKHWLECYKAEIPTKYAVYNAWQIHSGRSKARRKMGATSQIVMFMYLEGLSIAEIAISLNCSRERIRQMIWKIVRTSRTP